MSTGSSSALGRVVDRIPLRLLCIAVILALVAFVALTGVTIYAVVTHQIVEIYSKRFGRAPDDELIRRAAVLDELASYLEKVNSDPSRGLCIKWKDNNFTYCFETEGGNFVSYNKDGVAYRGLGKSPENPGNK
jgi:hypothetical protein